MHFGTLTGAGGKKLSRIEEMAYLCCSVVADSLSDWIDSRNQQLEELALKIKHFKYMLVAGAVIATTGVGFTLFSWRGETARNIGVAWLVAGLIMAAWVFYLTQKTRKQEEAVQAETPPIRIDSLQQYAWEGDLVPTGDQFLLIDRSGIYPEKSLEFNSLAQGWEKPLDLLASISDLLADPPVLSSAADTPDQDHHMTGEYEVSLVEFVNQLKGVMLDLQQRSVDINIVPPSEDLATAMAGGKIPPDWTHRIGSSDFSSKVANLHSLYRASSKSESSGESELENQLSSRNANCESGLESLDSVRGDSIETHLVKELNELNKSFFLPMVRLVCPTCDQKAMDEIDVDAYAEDVTTLAADSMEGEFEEQKQELARRSRVFKVSTLKYRANRDVFYCEQCRQQFAFEEVEGKAITRVKEELVYPLWDRLWDELETERHRILREKEHQMLENRRLEHDELNRAQAEFLPERRNIKNRLADIQETCRKTEQSIEGLLDALYDMDLIDEDTRKHYNKMTAKDRTTITSDIKELSDLMKNLEQEMEQMADKVFDNRNILIDEVDAVKQRGRFFTLRHETKAELSIANG